MGVVKAPPCGMLTPTQRGALRRGGVGRQCPAGPTHTLRGPQDYCGQNSSWGSFSIITENVPCGTTGVTCSKAIKIFMGVSAARPPGCVGSWGPWVWPVTRHFPWDRGQS